MRMPVGLAGLFTLTSTLWVAAVELKFEAVTIDPEIGKVCYAVTVADVNADGRLDVVAVSENRVQWYENPTWTKHLILEDQTERDNVCIAAHDIDGDGQVDFAIGAGWTKIGTLQWITRAADPKARWNVHFIAQETWLHRASFADVLGRGKPQLVVSPLNKTMGDGVRLMAFEIPGNPRTERWPATILNESLDRMHNHTHLRWDADDVIDTVVASEQGVLAVTGQPGGGFAAEKLGSGASGNTPAERGAGEIKVGQLANGQRFLATIEPMHGTQAVIYLPGEPGQLWQRLVIDDSLKQGHAVWAANLDGQPGDEIVVGHREPGPGAVKGPGLYVFTASADGQTWSKQVVDDGGVAVEDALAADLNGDGLLDLIAGGRTTHNVKLYLQRRAE